MKTHNKSLVASILALLGLALLTLPQLAAPQLPNASAEPIPAFHAEPPNGELPPTMAPSLYADKLVFNAYWVAGRAKAVLYQQPCYCHCDRSSGHGSLLDCFVGRHGAVCGTCQKEALFSYEQTHKGKTPAQIREAIIRGDWQKIDLTKYDKDYLPTTHAAAK